MTAGAILLAVVTAATVTFAGATPATAAPPSADRPATLVRATPTGTTALPGTKASTWPRRTTSGRLNLTSRVADPALAAKSLRRAGVAPAQLSCAATIDVFNSGVGLDDFLEETVGVSYDAVVECNYFLSRAVGAAGAFDRSRPFNGENFDGLVIGGGTLIDEVEVSAAESIGGFRANAISYNGARRVEPAFELFLRNPAGLIWGECGPLDGLRYLLCDGLGTETLHIIVGTGRLRTGLATPCRDFRAGLDPEQARLYEFAGGSPASTQLITRINRIRDELTSFRKALCEEVDTAPEATPFFADRGQRLWDVAVRMARQGRAGGDDRPLYWARIGMSVALQQWRPPFDLGSADRAAINNRLERTSRGMESATFATTGRRVFISGYDPFGLDSRFGSIMNGNESGASVLRLDGQTVNGAEVQAVIFPVRYDDFDAGLVEQVYQPVLNQGVDRAISVSEGVDNPNGDFELEYYNGRNRTTGPGFPDNRNRTDGDPANPQPPPGVGSGRQFTATTLPVDGIDQAPKTVVDHKVREILVLPQGRQPSSRDDGPTVASIAVEGGGGGFLSNEIAYRVTRLRDALGSRVAAGHIHTPSGDGSDSGRTTITGQFETILSTAVNAAPSTPVRITTDRSTYVIGDSVTYTVTGPPNTDVLFSTAVNGFEVENDTFAGRTDANGVFTTSVGPVGPDMVGRVTRQVRLNKVIADVDFTVNP